MSRRAIVLLLLGAIALLAALVPWTVTSERVTGAIARQIRDEYGLRLAVGGRATVALLPVPSLKLADVTFSDETGTVVAEAALLKAELRMASLLLARLRMSEVRIAQGTFRVAPDRSADALWPATLARLNRRLGGGTSPSSHIERVVVTASQVVMTGPGRPGLPAIRKLNLVLSWPEPGGDMDVAGSGEWEGETVSGSFSGLNPAQLLAGADDKIDLKLTTRLGRAGASGALSWKDAPRFTGSVSGHAPSLASVVRWTGLGLDLQDLDQPLSLKADGTIGETGIEWPQVTLDLGRDRLEGSIAYREDGPRPQMRATLAGEDLDLGWVLTLVHPGRTDRPRMDYDVRLSALGVRMGTLRLRDVATGILVGGERLEVSLARATLAGGSVRGRLSAALEGEGRDLRGQIALDKVDLEKLLGETGAWKGLSGTLAGQVAFEAFGGETPDVARTLKGRASLTARDGEIAGISLGEAARAPESRKSGAPPSAWRGGRTRFGHAAVTFELADGRAEIVEGVIDTTATQTSIRGRVSLTDGTVAVRATTTATAPTANASEPRPPLVLHVRGPLDEPTVTAADPDKDPVRDATRAPR